ncbi:protein wech-like [Stylophora pistillata]|uniref:protein wech-like n=1 Tax=Stylophora pistillata TaxID=50429 RepID=UPI000C043D0B|nr:protein wech-like [Stylophora pistillata]
MTQPQLVIGGPGEKAGELKGARGVTVDKDNRIVVCDRNNFRVQIFDSLGEFLFAFGNKGSSCGEFPGGPLGVAVSNDGKFFVSDWSGRTVQMFDAKGKFVKRLKLPEDEDEKCAKFSYVVFGQKEQQVYITDCQNRKIYVFDSNGEYLSHFQVGCPDEDDGLRSKLRGVAINRKGEIVTSLVNDGALQVLSTDGKPLRHISLPFSKSDKVFAPGAITVDSNDNMLMADGMRNCLLVFSGEDGHLIAECARESLCKPYGVAVDRVGRVIMTDSSNQIKIF